MTRIPDPDYDGTVRSVLTLPTDVPEKVWDFYTEHRVLERAVAFPGCLSAEWWTPIDGGDPQITALWTGLDRYQAWVRDPWRGSLTDELATLLRAGTLPAGALYQVSSPSR